jgi:phosphonate transport system substrate-binding protein
MPLRNSMRRLSGRVRAFDRLARLSGRAHGAALLVAVVAATVLVWHAQAAGPGDPVPQLEAYRLGVFPYLPVLAIDRIYGPVAAQFAEDLGRPVHLKTKPTFRKFADELGKGTYDIILVHPFFYVEARDQHHYVPLARLEEPLTAVIMVPKDGPLKILADLKGKKIGLPPALSAVTGLVRTSLLDAGLVPGVDVALEHYRFKPSCLQAVASGRAAACGLPRFALAQIDPNIERKLRLIFETEPVSNFLFAAHARVPETDRIDLTKSILAWPFTADGRKILAGGAWTRFVPARDQEYDQIRRYLLRLRHIAER